MTTKVNRPVLDLSALMTRKNTAYSQRGGMNKLEAAYADELEALLRAGHITAYKFEGLKLRLADKTFYTPDFLVISNERRVELHETKGFWRDDARVKIKVAAEMYPWFHFVGVQKQSKKQGGSWKFELFGR